MTVFELLGKIAIDNKSAISSINATETAADKASGKTQKHFSAMGGVLKKAVLGASVAAGVAVAAFTGKAIADFGSFDKSMKEVFTLLPGISGAAMAEMNAQVLQTSKEIGRLPNETVPALYQSLSAGVPKENVFEFLKTASKAADAGATDLTTAVNGITSSVNAYGAETLSAEQASDAMFTTVRLGKTTFAELSDSLFNVSPVASALGVDFGDVSAGMAAITLQGVPTNVAATQLRQLFIELSKEGGETATTFERVAGKSFKQFVSEGGNVQQALQLMEGEAKATGVGINDLFGSVEAGGAALALTGKGTKAFGNALDEMANSAGATEAAFQTMEQSSTESFENIKVAVGVATIEVGQKLAPAFADFSRWVERNMPAITSAVVGAFGSIADGIQYVTTNVIPPIQAAFRGTRTEGETQFSGLASTIKTSFDIIGDVFKIAALLWTNVLKPSWSTIAPYVSGVFGLVAGTIKAFKLILEGDFTGAWVAAIDGLKGFLTGLEGFLDNFFGGLWSLVKPGLIGMRDVILAKGEEIRDGFSAKLTELKTAVFEWSVDLWAGIAATMSSFVGHVVNAALEVYNGFTDGFYDLRDKTVEIISGLWDGVKSHLETFATNVVSQITGIPERIKDVGQSIVDKLIAGITGKKGDLEKATSDTVGVVEETAADTLQTRSPSKALYKIGEWGTLGLAGGVADTQAVKAVTDAAESVGSGLVDAINKGLNDPAALGALRGTWDMLIWEAQVAALEMARAANEIVLRYIPNGSSEGPSTGTVGWTPPAVDQARDRADARAAEAELGATVTRLKGLLENVGFHLGAVGERALTFGTNLGNALLDLAPSVVVPFREAMQPIGEASAYWANNLKAQSANDLARSQILLDTDALRYNAANYTTQMDALRAQGALATQESINANLAGTATWIGSSLGSAVSWVGSTLSSAASWVGSTISNAASFIGQAAGNIGWELIKLAASDVPGLGAAMGAMAGGPIAMLTAFFVDLISETWQFQSIIEVATRIMQPLINTMGRLIEAIWPLISITFAKLDIAVQGIAWVFDKILNPAINFVARTMASVWNAMATTLNRLLGWLGVRIPTINVNAGPPPTNAMRKDTAEENRKRREGADRKAEEKRRKDEEARARSYQRFLDKQRRERAEIDRKNAPSYKPPKSPGYKAPKQPGEKGYKPPKGYKAPGAPGRPGSPGYKAPKIGSPGRGGTPGYSAPGGGSSGGSGGTKVSEITGPTRDLFADLLSPLVALPELIGIGNRTFDLLNQRLTGGTFAPAAVSAAASLAPLNLTVNMNATGKLEYDGRKLAQVVTPYLAQMMKAQKRGSGR